MLDTSPRSHELNTTYTRFSSFLFFLLYFFPLKVTEDEIANAAGISDMHDGVNFMRAACVIAVEKVNSVQH